MIDPTIFCPQCKAEVKLTESLIAPFVETARQQLELQNAKKESDLAKRESTLAAREHDLVKAQDRIQEQIEEKLMLERQKIVEDESKKAAKLYSLDLETKNKELADLGEVLKQREAKLAEAAQAQADLIKKQRELDDAKREMGLTIEKQVQASLANERDKAKKEAEDELKTMMMEKEQFILSMQEQIDGLKQNEVRIADKEAEMVKREQSVKLLQENLAKAQDRIQEQIEEKLMLERQKIVEDESKKAAKLYSLDLETKNKELADLGEVLKQREAKLAEAAQAQADLIKKQRELDDAKREMGLTIEKQVQASLANERDKAKKEAEDELLLKVEEKNQTIRSMTKQIEELKRKAEQGSQQLQGEVQELVIEEALRRKFPTDTVDPVPKGEFGGDTLHCVKGPMNQSCGTILWESKRTKAWNDGWLSKLRDDQRAAKAEFAVIVSNQLPKEVEAFDLIDGVWVTSPKYFIPVAIALRHSLIELATARKASEGQQTKMEMVYLYLIGSQFKQRVQAIVEAFTTMQEDLARERRAIAKQWNAREKQIERVMQATVGMYGDLQGIAGKSLQEIEGLTLAIDES